MRIWIILTENNHKSIKNKEKVKVFKKI
jgi:hypothetical protein